MYRVIEFYSGIGGMHYSLKESDIHAQVVEAIDVNDIANRVYEYNFNRKVNQRNIESLNEDYYDNIRADVFLISPPCQPYTRTGLKKGALDARSQSFLKIIEQLPKLTYPPAYILIENVKGFEESDTRELLVTQLKNCAYTYQEFMLSPHQFGIPNSRSRYFLLAKKSPRIFKYMTTNLMNYNIPGYSMPEHPLLITTFLHNGIDRSPELYLSNETLWKYGTLLDIVQPSSNRSCCFTKAYGHYIEGTGSVLQENDELKKKNWKAFLLII